MNVILRKQIRLLVLAIISTKCYYIVIFIIFVWIYQKEIFEVNSNLVLYILKVVTNSLIGKESRHLVCGRQCIVFKSDSIVKGLELSLRFRRLSFPGPAPR